MSSTSDGSPPVLRNQKNTINNHIDHDQDHDHDYEDIYLVREEASNPVKTKYTNGRSRSRDSGSHSRSASASSTHSSDVIIQYGNHVCYNNYICITQFFYFFILFKIMFFCFIFRI